MANYITRHPVKFTFKLSGLGLLVYGIWWLWSHRPFQHTGGGGNPWGGGGSSDDGIKPDDRPVSPPNPGGGAKVNIPNSGAGNDGSGQDVADVIVTKTDSYTKSNDGKYYSDTTGALYTGDTSVNGTKRRRGMYDALNMSRTDFISKFYQPAIKAQMQSGVYPETMFAQAFLEGSDSNGVFGQSPAMVAANNLFNIKTDSNWSGDTWDAPDGSSYRKYGSMADTLADYYSFLKENSRYADALNANNATEQIQAIADAGYAEDPNYATKLISLVPYIESAENVIKSGGGNTTAKPGTEKASADSGNDTLQNIFEFYQNHTKTVQIGGGGLLLFGLTYLATDGFKKNPLRALIK